MTLTKHSGNRVLKALAILAIGLVGCGTIMHQTRQSIGISSAPIGAKVTIDGIDSGTTPVIADLKRRDDHIIKVELKGYEPFAIPVTHSVSGWVWGNILFGGLIGLAVDAISGGLYKLSPEQVSAELRKGSASVGKSGQNELAIFIVLTPRSDWEKIGRLELAN